MNTLNKTAIALALALTVSACGDSGEKSAVDNAIDATKEAASNAVDATTNAASDAVDGAEEMANKVADGAAEMADGAKEMAGDGCYRNGCRRS